MSKVLRFTRFVRNLTVTTANKTERAAAALITATTEVHGRQLDKAAQRAYEAASRAELAECVILCALKQAQDNTAKAYDHSWDVREAVETERELIGLRA